jgi:hypothetical protein
MAKPFRWYVPRGAVVAAAAAMTALGCTDRSNPIAPGGEEPGGGTTGGASIPLAQLTCSVSVAARTVACKAPEATTTGARGDIIYGGQDIFVVSTTSSVNYDAGTHKFTFNLKLRNLLRQAIGTTDGVATDPSGVKVFFHQLPTATSGTGTIAIDNADGVGAFTAANQPYYAYVQLIDSYLESSNKLWQFDVPPTVASFEFKLYISSPVQFPHGWIDVSEPDFSLRRTYSKTLFGVVRDQFGRVIPGAVITWSSANPTLATVNAADGTVTGALPGTVDIVASSTNDVLGTPGATQTGAGTFHITGTSLTWTGALLTTDWNAPGNWDRGVSPVAEDSATIPVVATTYPVLAANQSIGSITVADAAQLDLSAFDLTVSQDAISGVSGGIVGSTGRIVLTGIAKSTEGRMPRMRVNGTYNMTGNINAIAPFRVEGGRMRNTSFRLRVISQ